MTSKEARQLIGKPVRYCKTGSFYVRWCEVTVIDVKGRNVLIDHGGMTDWLWLPDVCIEPLPEAQP